MPAPSGRPFRRAADALAAALRAVPLGVYLGLAGLAGALSGASPTALAGADIAFAAALAAGVAWLCSIARRWSWIWIAGVAATVTVATPLVFGVALVGFGLALLAQAGTERSRRLGAVVGGLSIAALLRAPEVVATGGSAVVTVVACLPVLVSAVRVMPPSVRRRTRTVVLVTAGVLGLATLGAVVAVAMARGKVESAVAESEAALSQVERADRSAAVADLQAAQADLDDAAMILRSPLLVPAEAVPVVGQNVRALRVLSAQGEELLGQARRSVESVDYESLRYRDGAIDLAEVRRAEPALERLDASFDATQAAIDDADTTWIAPPLASRMDEFGATLDERGAQARTAALAARLAPGMLGGESPRRWLVVFPTPAELRGGGGFVGNYAILDARDGEVELTDSSRIIEMIDARPPGERTITGLPDYLRRFGRFRPADYPQDILHSPHFPDDAAAFAQVAEQSGLGQIDGVVSIDPDGLAALLRLTGPVPVIGRDEPLAAEDARQWLLFDQYLAYGGDDEARSDALAQLSEDVFDRLTSGTLAEPRELGAVFGPMVRGGHLAVWSSRPDEQELLSELGVTRELPEVDGRDVLLVSGTNGSNNKIDVYLRRQVELDVDHDPTTGEITSTVRVTLTNDAPTEGLPPYVIGNLRGEEFGSNLHLLSVHTPLGLQEARVDGQVVATESSREHGLSVYGRYVEVPPGESVVVELDLAGVVPDMDAYELVVPFQTMVHPDELVVTGSALGAERRATLDEAQRFTSDAD